MNWKLITLGVVILSLLICVAYTQNDIIKFVSKQGFQNAKLPSGTKEFVLYYAKWCGHCKNVLPIFKELGSEVVVGGQTVKVSIYEAEEDKEMHQKNKITSYPTIKFYDASGDVTEYKGTRTAEAFLKFLEDNLGGKI